MSWIGGLNDSFSQLTSKAGQISGQLTTFTKEVLSESTDEVVDIEAEVHSLRIKLSKAEAAVCEYEAKEKEQLKTISLLQDQCRKSELEAHSRNLEHEAKLRKQQRFINKLKQEHNIGSDEEFQIVSREDSNSSSFRRTISGSSEDAAEYADVIQCQQEINRLSEEVGKLEMERDRWKSLVQSSQASSLHGDVSAQEKVKELEMRLHETSDRHQHEYLALQQANAASLQQLQDENRKLRLQLPHYNGEEISEQLSSQNVHLHRKEVSDLSAEIEELKEKLRTRNRQLQVQKKTIDELQTQRDEGKEKERDLQSKVQRSQTDCEELKAETLKIQAQFEEQSFDLHKLIQDIASVVLSKEEVFRNGSLEDIIQHVKNLRERHDRYRDELAKVNEELEKDGKEKNDNLAESDQWHIESSECSYGQSSDTEDQNSKPEDELQTHRPVHLSQPLYQSSPQAPFQPRPDVSDDNFLIVTPNHSRQEVQESDLTMTLQALQKQVEDYEVEIAQYELVQKEWQDEKQSLQVILERYESERGSNNASEEEAPSGSSGRAMAVTLLRKELDELRSARVSMEKDKQKLLLEKEQLQSAALNLQEELNMSITDALTERENFLALKKDFENTLEEKKKLEEVLKNVGEELNSSRMEKAELDEAIDTLDAQHQDEMAQLLKIRDELTQNVKTAEEKLKAIQNENENLETKNRELTSIINSPGNSNDFQLKGVQEDLAALIDDKQYLEEQMKKSQLKFTEMEKKVAYSEEAMLNAETAAEEIRIQLAVSEKEKLIVKDKLAVLEMENQAYITDLQQQVQDYVEQLQISEQRIDAVEKQKKKMEQEQKITASKMHELALQHEKVIEEIDSFREEKRENELELHTMMVKKDQQIGALQTELNSLQEQNRLRLEDFGRQTSNETSTEVSSLKNELSLIQQLHESTKIERNNMRCNLQDAEDKAKALGNELRSKTTEIASLMKQLEAAKRDVVVKVQETIIEYDAKSLYLKEEHNKELSHITTTQEAEYEKLKETYETKIEQMLSDHEDNLKLLIEEQKSLKYQNCCLKERVKFMEQDVGNEVEIIQEKFQQSDILHSQKEEELTAMNGRLEKELLHERSLVENLEDELKKQIEANKSEHEKYQQEINQSHSSLRNEISILKASFDEEKANLKGKYDERISITERNLEDHIGKLKEYHAKEIAKTASELKESHKIECENLQERLNYAQEVAKQMEDELKRAQDDLITISEHYEKEEEKWKRNISQSLEKVNQSHNQEMMKLQSEGEELMQRTLMQSVDSIGNELTNSQLKDLQDTNHQLLAEIDQLKTKSKEHIAKHNNETAKLQEELFSQKEHNVKLVNENSALKATSHLVTPELKEKDVSTSYEATIASLKSELENLKLASIKDVGEQSSNTVPVDINQILQDVKTGSLDGLEKVDLSKEDISSLLALIKERDNAIDALSAELQSKESSTGHEQRVVQLTEEKEQILNVVSEKSKENRNLKDELHKMVDIVAAGKSALAKVQEENQALLAKYGGMDQEMTKEAVAQLSKLISEKDLEIESLKQKCQTLLDVLHQQEERQGSSPGGDTSSEPANISALQIQGLLKDRETLSQQVRQLLTERDHLVTLVNTKHQEALLFQDEAKKAAESLERDAAENSRLQVSYSNLVHDYEQLEIKQSSMQKQLSKFKESLNDLEESKEILLSKLDIEQPASSSAKPSNSSINEVMENLRSDASKTSSDKSKEELLSIVEKKSETLLQKDILLQESIDKYNMQEKQIKQLQIDLREKDILIHKKMEEKAQQNDELAQRTNEVNILRKSVENLRDQVSSASSEAESLRKNLKNLEISSTDKDSESQAFQETNAQLSVMLKEREYELETLREKVESLNDLLQRHQHGKDSESQKYLKELDRAKEQTTMVKHERDQIMLTLKQKQLESQRASEEARQLRDKESKLQSELTRLRGHLVQVEETYTQEAVLSSEREQQLRNRLEQIQSKNATAVEANELSKQQMESLQEQIRAASQQRDQAIHNFQVAQEQSTQYANALHQLQLAAERMQREEAATYNARVGKINQQYELKVHEAEKLVQQVSELKVNLDEATIALESASRLNEQLESKEQTIDNLKELVSEKQLQLENVQDELHKANAKSDGMVDKQLVKNLLIGYFNTPAAKQPDVVRLISSVIGFTKEEEEKLQPTKKGWVGGWLSWGRGGAASSVHQGGALGTTPTSQHQADKLNESFTGMFVKFLEDESAKREVVKLPAAEMVNDAQQRMNQRKIAAEGIPTPAFNPPSSEHGSVSLQRSTVAGRYNPFLVTASSASGTSASASSTHPLMQPLGSMLPTFTPFASVKPSSERDILQGILQPDSTSSPS